ncbi:MAG: TIGR03435 family protein [Acidobacteriota bacterium]
MAKADPENRGACKEGPGPDGKDPRKDTPSRSRLYTCLNLTMAEFAERLQGIASGYLKAPVVDATKLEGMWDFTLNFSPAPNSNGNGSAPVPLQVSPAPVAADPSDALTLFEAVASQLGLKLEAEKRMMPVLVIDHVDEGPTEN